MTNKELFTPKQMIKTFKKFCIKFFIGYEGDERCSETHKECNDKLCPIIKSLKGE